MAAAIDNRIDGGAGGPDGLLSLVGKTIDNCANSSAAVLDQFGAQCSACRIECGTDALTIDYDVAKIDRCADGRAVFLHNLVRSIHSGARSRATSFDNELISATQYKTVLIWRGGIGFIIDSLG